MIVNFVYLLRYIIKLEQKSFHLMMFALLLGSQLFYIGFSLILLIDTFVYDRLTEQRELVLFQVSSYFVMFDSILEYVSHSIFVIKYWVVANKITSILKLR